MRYLKDARHHLFCSPLQRARTVRCHGAHDVAFGDETQKLIGTVDDQYRADAKLGQNVHHVSLNGRDLMALLFTVSIAATVFIALLLDQGGRIDPGPSSSPGRITHPRAASSSQMMRALCRSAQILTVRCTISRRAPSSSQGASIEYRPIAHRQLRPWRSGSRTTTGVRGPALIRSVSLRRASSRRCHGAASRADDKLLQDEEKASQGRTDANMPALLTKDVPAGLEEPAAPQNPASPVLASLHMQGFSPILSVPPTTPSYFRRRGALDALRPQGSSLIVGSQHYQPMEATNGCFSLTVKPRICLNRGTKPSLTRCASSSAEPCRTW